MLNINFHFAELKFRFYYVLFSFFLTFCVSYLHAEIFLYLYTFPFLKFQLFSHKIILTNFIFTNLSEAFNSYIFISLLVSIYFTFLTCIQSLFSYLRPGLFKHEKCTSLRFIQFFIIYMNVVLLLLTQLILPIFVSFFLSFEKPSKIALFTIRCEAKLFDYLILSNKFIIFSSILFLIPFFLFCLLAANLFPFALLKKNRRFVILSFFILGAIFSSPDIYSQLLIAIPLSFCFELTIFLFYLKKIYFSRFDKIFFKKHS